MCADAMAVYRDTLLILGGQRSPSGLAPTADILAYDPETDSWSEWGSLPVAVWDLYAFGVGDELVVLDGNAFVSPPGRGRPCRVSRGRVDCAGVP